MSDTIVKVVDVCKSFANNGVQNHVLNQVNLEIYKEDFTVIMGPSGAGKSTLLYSISGMDRITSGEVYVGSLEISKLKENQMASLRRSTFGFIFQQMHLVSNLTLFENVAVPGYVNKQKKTSEVNTRASKLLEQVNLTEEVKRLPSQVSGGEQQRAAIARALINEPEIVFADEPTGALNRKNSKDVMNLLSNINRQGQTIVMVTHDMKAAIHGNRILYLSDGSICGELTLPPFEEEDRKKRETQLNAWLSSMEW
ncbi:MAG: ABC transporter ATP-binding protein [bacterium]|nr:ABC transporter ATP-binding protein [bacterium]